MKSPYEILVKPIITEKSTRLGERATPQYAFQVATSANKVEIKRAIEAHYGVKVKKVATINVFGKQRRVRGQIGRRPNWKKAYVTLEQGQELNLY